MASFVSQFVIPSNDGYRVWEDPSFIKWRKRDAHVSLHCHDTVEGSLKYWYERNKVDLLVSNSAVWDDDAVSGALDCAAFWVKGLPFVKSLSGYWKFLLAPRPSDVPLNFYDSEFQDSVWETLPVPSNWQMHGFDLPVYISAGYAFPIDPPNIPADNPTGCYRTYFHLPKEWEGRRIFLHFEAVDSALHAWINGFSVGYRPVRTVDYLLSLKSLISVIHVDQTRKTFWLFKYINGAMVLTLKIKITGGYLAFIVMCFFWPSQRYSLQTIPSNQTWGKTFPMQIYSRTRVQVEVKFDNTGETNKDSILSNFTIEATVYDNGSWYGNDGNVDLLSSNVAHLELDQSSGRRSIGFHGYLLVGKLQMPKLWSAEQPNLYTLVITLRDASGDLVDCESCQVGIRQISKAPKQLLVNGHPVIIKGVNRHEHHPRLGKTNLEPCMVKDLVLMKQHNINAVRNSHYPQHPRWYELCDLFGMYMISEANIETHGFNDSEHAKHPTLEPSWASAMLDRVIGMVERDKNHACIISWSLGNESHYGPNHDALAGWIRGKDPSRLLHYEGGGARTTSTDIVCPMYMRVWNMVKIAEDPTETRPLILCEYSHSMGNSNGNINEYWEAIDSTFGLQGGFIWEWLDEGLLKDGADGNKHWAYGGDFGEKSEGSNFCLDGLTWPDRTPHPALHEVKYVYQPIKVSFREGIIKITNTHFFETTQALEFGWTVHGDGYELESGILPLPSIEPQGSYEIKWESGPWYSPWASSSAAEIFLTITAKLLQSTRWVESGHVISSTQVQLPVKGEFVPHVIKSKDATFLVEILGDTIKISQQNFWEIKFNSRTGGFESWKVEGFPVMHEGIFPCFWRAPTDNDKGGGEHSYFSKWKAAHLDNVFFLTESCSIQNMTDHLVKIAVVYLGVPKGEESSASVSEKLNVLFHVNMTYSSSGDVIMECNVKPSSDLPPLPRVGVEFHLDKSMDHIKWYGRGPFESYPDRKAAAHVGVYEHNVGDMHVPYIVPGECSGRADVRWVTFQNKEGFGIYASMYGGSPPMQMNASYYSTAELDLATHHEELIKGDNIEVHLDHKHMGLGGDDSWTPCVHEKYLISAVPYSFSIRLCPVTAATSCHDIMKTWFW